MGDRLPRGSSQRVSRPARAASIEVPLALRQIAENQCALVAEGLSADERQSPSFPQAGPGDRLKECKSPTREARADAAAPALRHTPHFHGHRRRLRQRFHDTGAVALSDYELLELVLFRALPRRDVKPIAKDLIARFGSFAEVVNAPEILLAKVPGVGKETVTDLRMIAAAASRIARGAIKTRETLGSWTAVLDYCRTAMAFANKEEFRILFLDKRNQLIADEVQQVGTIDHTPVYPREVVKRALELSATAIILVHNHPSGDPTPSNADIQMTRQIVDIAGSLGISVHDHIIVGRNGHASLKGLKLM